MAADRARRVAEMHFRRQRRLAGRMADNLRRYFRTLGSDVAGRFTGERRGLDAEVLKGAGEILVTEADEAALRALLELYESRMWDDSYAVTATVVDVEPVGMTQAVRDRIASRVTRITEVTRDKVRDTITEAYAEGLADADIADRLRHVVPETYKGRADTIARTEIATVDQEATHHAYRTIGVTHVEIVDGPSCGWLYHDDPDKADGSVRTLEESEAHPVAHPNCVRGSSPMEPEEVEL